jgi:hypothetical protein
MVWKLRSRREPQLLTLGARLRSTATVTQVPSWISVVAVRRLRRCGFDGLEEDLDGVLDNVNVTAGKTLDAVVRPLRRFVRSWRR